MDSLFRVTSCCQAQALPLSSRCCRLEVIMLLAFTVYHLAGQSVQALPISESVIDPRSLPNHCDDLNECRTIWDIIRSCLATIFACTWLALHMNIPGRNTKWYMIALRKAGVMLLALIAPEIVIMWAMRQWLVAHRIAKKYKGVYCYLL